MSVVSKHIIYNGTSIREALLKLNNLGIDSILFVADSEGRLIGSLTDGDVRRGLLKGFGVEDLVENIIQPNPKFIRKGERDINKVIDYRENHFRIIPILDKEDRVVNVINFRELKSYLPIDAVIMAGGRGERLRPLTDEIPKPLLPVGDKPIIEHNIDRLRLYGIDDFWITLRYRGKQIEEYIGNGIEKNITINFFYENEALGTIGAVSQIKNFVHEYVIVANSDLLSNIDYELFFLDFLKNAADFSVVTIPYRVDIPYAVLETSNGQIVSFKEKPAYTYYSNGGIYLIKRELLEYIPIEKSFNATDLMEKLISLGKKVISYPFEGYWLDIGKHEDYDKAQQDVEKIKF